jgi:hypothetical protein
MPEGEVLRGLENRAQGPAARERDRRSLHDPKLNGGAQELRRPEPPTRLYSLLGSEPSWRPAVFRVTLRRLRRTRYALPH